MLEELAGKERVTGLKQTRRAVLEKRAERVFLARDADEALLASILALCRESGVPVCRGCTMQQLGRACRIQVRCAAAAVLRPE